MSVSVKWLYMAMLVVAIARPIIIDASYKQAEFNSRIKIIDQTRAAQIAFNEDRYGFDEDLKPVPETETPPPPAAEVQAEASPSAVEISQPVDSRPVVVVDTLPARLCAPCGKFAEWHATYKESFPLRFDVREVASVNALPQVALESGTPLFRFQGSDGKWYMHRGWIGPADMLLAYQANNHDFGKAPAPKLAAASAAGNPLDYFLKFAGSGSFSWAPDKPVAGYVDDSTYLSYSKLNLKVTASGGKVFAKLQPPLPEVSKLVGFGPVSVWGKAQVLEFSTDPKFPGQVEILHTRGKLKLTIESLK